MQRAQRNCPIYHYAVQAEVAVRSWDRSPPVTCDLGNLPKTGERVRTCALRGAGAVAVEDAGPCRGAECNDIWGNSAAPVASRVPFSPKKAYATLHQQQ